MILNVCGSTCLNVLHWPCYTVHTTWYKYGQRGYNEIINIVLSHQTHKICRDEDHDEKGDDNDDKVDENIDDKDDEHDDET